MSGAAPKSILHGKFSSWLPWHQPFLADLLAGLDASYRNVVLCNRVENEARFPRPDVVALKSRALLQPSAAVVCAADLRSRFAPSLLHGHFGWSGARLLLLKSILRIPLVTTFGGRDAGVQVGAEKSAPLYRILLDACDRIVCVSHHLKGELAAAGADPDRIEVVHRGTDLERFPVVDRAGRPVVPFRMLMVGRLVEKKGHGDALAALARLRQSGRAAELAIVGVGPAEDAIRAEARRRGVAEHVTLYAPMERSVLRERLAAADVFVHCSVRAADGDVEGIPNVVVEAAATGLPVVGTRHGGIVEVVEDGKSGLLVGEREPEALAAALARLAAEPGRRLEMGRAAAARARAAFDLRAQVAAHEALYAELLAEVKPRPVALPDDYFALARRAIGGGARAWDHTLAAAAQALLAPLSVDPSLAAAPRGLVDRALEAPTGWPRPWRSAAELALDVAGRAPLAPLGGFRKRTRKRADALDRAVLARLREGAELAGAPTEAAVARALRDLRGEPPPTGWRRLRERIAGGGAEPGDEV
ncbi:MAG TPA: glycosyltransferase [Myxococcota bacterium]|nr:glycosyltransferase [Myxococcota bacterium]